MKWGIKMRSERGWKERKRVINTEQEQKFGKTKRKKSDRVR